MNGLEGEWRPAAMDEQPRPVILDPHCRAHLPKLHHLVAERHAKAPWIICRETENGMPDQYIPLPLHHGKFSWTEILSALNQRGIKSVMIEGGATVINDVLSLRIADVVIITIAPVFLGHDGVGIAPVLQAEWLHNTTAMSAGRDLVIAGIINP